MKKLVSLVLALCLMLCATFSLADSLTVTDMKGRTITLAEPAQKVVVLTAADVEIVYALGAGEQVAAVGAYCDYPEQVLTLPVVQSGYETNIEEIIALSPDAVITDIMNQTVEQVEALEKAGVPVITTDANSIAQTYEAITLIGQVMGKEAEAAAMVADMQARFATVEAAAKQTGKTVYFEVSPLQWGLWAAGNGSFMQEMAQLCGLTNIFADQPAWAEVSSEQVIALNPDYILTTTAYYGEGEMPDAEIIHRAGWEGISAVQNGAVYAVDSNLFSRPGPRLAQAAEELLSLVQK